MIDNNSDKIKEEIFACRHCGNKTSHGLIYLHSVDVPLGIYDPEGTPMDAADYFFLFECKTCRGISLKEVFSEELDMGSNGYEIPFDNIDYLYPSSQSLNDAIPKGLILVIKEANKVKLISPMAYLILVRKILDELCKERGIKGKNLEKKLIKLVQLEKLPDIFGDASNNLRLLGNIGAHESKVEINNEDIQLVEEFIFALIEYIYVMPSKLRKLNEALKKQVKVDVPK